jgi:hypothetical protein
MLTRLFLRRPRSKNHTLGSHGMCMQARNIFLATMTFVESQNSLVHYCLRTQQQLLTRHWLFFVQCNQRGYSVTTVPVMGYTQLSLTCLSLSSRGAPICGKHQTPFILLQLITTCLSFQRSRPTFTLLQLVLTFFLLRPRPTM